MKRNALFCLFAILALLPAIQNVQAQVEPLPIDSAVRIGRLPNGLTYYIRHNALPRQRADFYLAQKVGSVQEEENQRGLAHFLEHMCFNGTRHFPGNSLGDYCESIGVKYGENLNAYTSTDETVYNIDNVPVSEGHIDSMLLILSDWSNGLLLESDEIDKERGVIHEEWRLSSDAGSRMFERNLPALYPGSRYANRYTIGLMSVVDHFKPEELRAYYHKWYRPDLQAVIVVGDVDVDRVEEKIKALFAPIAMPKDPAKYELYPVPANPQPIYVVDKDKEQTTAQIMLNFKQPTLNREMRGSSLLLLQEYMRYVICSALNARLTERSLKPDCPFVSAGTGADHYLMSKTEDAFTLSVRPKPGQDAAAVEAAMSELERARRFGLTEGECSRAAAQALSAVEKLYDNREKQYNSYYVEQYVRHFLEGDALPSLATLYAYYRTFAAQLHAPEFSQTLRTMVASIDTNFVCLAFYPDKEGVPVPSADELHHAVEQARQATLQAYVDSVKTGPLVARLPRLGRIKKESEAKFGYHKLTLQNGAEVYFKQTDFDESNVSFSARSFGGLAYVDDADLYNARILPMVVGATGIGNFTATELSKKLAGKQVNIGAGMSQACESLSGNAAPKDLRTLFELIYLSFGPPANDPESYNNLLARLRVQLANAEKEPTTALRDSVFATLYDHDPRVRSLRLADLERVSYEGVRRLYAQRFASPSDFKFFFVGHFNEDSLRLFCRQYIASLPKGRTESMRDPHIETHQGETTNDFSRAMQTPKAYVLQYFSGAAPYLLSDATTMNFIGQILTKRYDKQIREEAGIAYYCGADAELSRTLKDEYSLQIQCPVKPADVDTCLVLIAEGLEGMARDGVSNDELRDVRAFMLKQFADNQRENGYWQNLIINNEVWGVDYHTGYEEAVKSVTSDGVKRLLNDVVLGKKNRVTVVMRPESLQE